MKFLAIARMAFFRQAFYRFELFFNALRAVVFVFVISAVWRAVYQARPSVAGLTIDAVIFYTCTAMMLTLLYATFDGSPSIHSTYFPCRFSGC